MKILTTWLSQDFWLQLREKSRVNESIERGFCDFWCDDALQLLPQEVRSLFERRTIFNLDSEILIRYKLLYHQWIEINRPDLRFIADGTAGQIFPEHPKGYYGFYDKSPPELKKFYSGAL